MRLGVARQRFKADSEAESAYRSGVYNKACVEDPRLRVRVFKTKIFIFISFLSHNSAFVFPSLSKNLEAKIKQRVVTKSICLGNQCARKKP